MKKKISLMILTILILQIILPLVTVIYESDFTIKSIAADTLETTDSNGITWIYEVEENQAINVKPKDKNELSEQVVIPSKLGEYTVAGIGSSAFEKCSNLKEIIIPEGVTNIESFAFESCSNLTSVKIPDTVTNIGSYAFSECSSLKEIIIPEKVENIGNASFSNCSNLTKIEVDKNNKNYISKDGILFNIDITKLMCYPAGKIETEYIIPETVTSLEDSAFKGCSNLTNIKIPDTVTNIERDVFYDCSNLKEITIPEGVTSIGDWLFCRCSNLVKVNIPDTVTSIGNKSFLGCEKLTYIKIPKEVTSIGENSFSGCYSLKEITIQEGVTSIGAEAFSFCIGLKEISIPEGVTSIGEKTFEYCIGLTSIKIPDSVIEININAFENCDNLENIYVNDSNGKYKDINGVLWKRATDTEEEEKLFSPPANMKVIKSWDISGNNEEKIQAVLYANGILKISGSGNMKDFSYELDVPWYNEEFNDKITKIEIQGDLKNIGSYAFFGCSNLEEITIPKTVKEIGEYAFEDCSSLKEIRVPGTTTLDDKAFEACPANIIVYWDISQTDEDNVVAELNLTTGELIIKGTGKMKNYDFSYDFEKTPWYISAHNEQIKKVIIEEGVENIGNYAFSGCSNLEEVELSNTIVSIGNVAFADCKQIKKIEIPSSIEEIKNRAFEDCTGLKEIIIKYSKNSIIFENAVFLRSIPLDFKIKIVSYRPMEIRYGTFRDEPVEIYLRYDISRDKNEGVIAEIGENGDAFIKGTGKMNDFDKSDSPVYFIQNVANIKKVKIEEGVENIGKYVFYNWNNLNEITIPETVEELNINAFENCYNLENIYVDDNNKIYEDINGVLWKRATETEDAKMLYFPPAKEAKISKIEVTEEPDITEYYEGDKIDLTGLVLIATYKDGTTETIESGYIYEPTTLLDTVGEQEIEVTYGDKSTTFIVTVKEVKLSKITAKINPNKTEFFVGDILEREDIILIAQYNNGKEETIKNFYYHEPILLETVGDQEIKVTYEDKSTTFKIKVKEVKLSKIEVTKVPEKTVYFEGEELNTTGLELTAIYNNGKKETIKRGYICTPTKLTGTGELTIKVTYEGKEATFTVNVKQNLEILINDYSVETEDKTNYIINIKPKTTVENIKAAITTNGEVKVYDSEGEKTEDKNLATGNKIKIILDEQEKEYIIVVKGDLTGDGIMNNIDLLKMARYKANLDKNLEGEYLKAADIYTDGNYADNIDILKMVRILANIDNF